MEVPPHKTRTSSVYRDSFVCLFTELAHVVTEAEKFWDLLSASWRPRKIRDAIQSEPKGLRMET